MFTLGSVLMTALLASILPNSALARRSSSPEAEAALARQVVAPHSLRIEASLRKALAELQRIENTLHSFTAGRPRPTADPLAQLHASEREIAQNLRTVASQQGELQTRLSKFPLIASSADFKELNGALGAARDLSDWWEERESAGLFWSDRETALRDVRTLEGLLERAIQKTRQFISNQVDRFAR